MTDNERAMQTAQAIMARLALLGVNIGARERDVHLTIAEQVAAAIRDAVADADSGYSQHSDALFALAQRYGHSPVSSQSPSEYLRQLLESPVDAEIDAFHLAHKQRRASAQRATVRATVTAPPFVAEAEEDEGTARAVQQWTACSERLPEPGQRVLCYTPAGDHEPEPWYRLVRCPDVVHNLPLHVTHWQPLIPPEE